MLGLSSADVDDLHVLGDSAGGYSGMRMLRVERARQWPARIPERIALHGGS